MTTERVTKTVRGYLAALNAHESLVPFLAPQATFSVPGFPNAITGAGAVSAGVLHHYSSEFDARSEILRLVADADGAAAELRFVGTHIGGYAGLAATGRSVDVPLAMWFDVGDDGITAIRVHYSLEQVLGQLR